MGLGVGTKFLSHSILRQEEEEEESTGMSQTELESYLEDTMDQFQTKKKGNSYGRRLRDCHAEILAKRAFRYQLLKDIILHLQQQKQPHTTSPTSSSYRPILRPSSSTSTTSYKFPQYELIPGITLHYYTSSTPCGNATLKKFAKMEKQSYDATLDYDTWPTWKRHEMIAGHSLHLGQFSLLLKKNVEEKEEQQQCTPVTKSKYYLPPGTALPTTTTTTSSIHSCSDKLCLYNVVGLQGSLLSSLLSSSSSTTPMYMSTLTVGRKFTECICRRAICCRVRGDEVEEEEEGKSLKEGGQQQQKKRKRKKKGGYLVDLNKNGERRYHGVNHPTLMGTAVYLDETGVIDMSGSRTIGQDVRFQSDMCWIWWPDRRNTRKQQQHKLGAAKHHDLSPQTNNNDDDDDTLSGTSQCINGKTGFIYETSSDNEEETEKKDEDEMMIDDDQNHPSKHEKCSEACTASFMNLYLEILHCHKRNNETNCNEEDDDTILVQQQQQQQEEERHYDCHEWSLLNIRALKRMVSPEYEYAKDQLLTKHVVFREWKRRGGLGHCQGEKES